MTKEVSDLEICGKCQFYNDGDCIKSVYEQSEPLEVEFLETACDEYEENEEMA